MVDTIYTDERLHEQLKSPMPGPRREAEILLTVPEEVRTDIVRVAHFERNMGGGIWSQALYQAKRLYESGRLEEVRLRQRYTNLGIHRQECEFGPKACDICVAFNELEARRVAGEFSAWAM